MAFIRASQGGGGGALSETTLWTNTAPTASFAAQSRALDSGSISDYTYLKFKFNYNNAADQSTLPHIIDVIVSVEDFKKSATGNLTSRIAAIMTNNSAGTYYRQMYWVDNTHVGFLSVNSNVNNSLIPTEIIGLK